MAGPADDVIAGAHVAQDEGGLNEHEFHNYFSLLMIAGNETTRHTITHGMLALMEHPEQLQLLQRRPELIPNATEEILRWATPGAALPAHGDARRRAARPARSRPGDKVVTWYISANRDEEMFADPYRST